MFASFEEAAAQLRAGGDTPILSLDREGFERLLEVEPSWVRQSARIAFETLQARTVADFLDGADRYFAGRRGRTAGRTELLALFTRAAGRAAPPPRPKPTLDARQMLAERLGPDRQAELESWAKEWGAEALLREPVSALEDAICPEGAAFVAPRRQTIAALLLSPSHAVAWQSAAQVKRWVLDALARLAPTVEAGQRYEAEAAPDRRRGAPELEPLLAHAREAWRRVRRSVAPRRPADVAETCAVKLGFRAGQPIASVVLTSPRRTVRVTLPLTPGGSSAHHCGQDAELPCAHALVAYDALMAALIAPTPPPNLAPVLESLATPAWLRALDALDHPPAEAPELSFWIEARDDHVLGVAPVLARRMARGALGPPKAAHPEQVLLDQPDLSLQERQLLDMLALRSRGGSRTAAVPVLEALVGLPRVQLGPSLSEARPATVTVVDPPVEIRADGDVLRLVFVVDGAALPAGIEPAVRRAGDRVIVLRPSSRTREVVARLGAALSLVAPQDRPRMAERVARLASTRLTAPALVPVDEEPARDAWITRLALRADGSLSVEVLVQPLADGPLYPAGEGPARALAPGAGGRLRAAPRQLERESAGLRERLVAWGLDAAGPALVLGAGTPSLRFLAALRDDPRGAVEWATEALRVLPRAARAKFTLRASADWFGVEGELELGEHKAYLALLLDAARRRSPFVPVAEHTWLELEGALLERLVALDAHVHAVRGRHEIAALSVPAVAELLHDQLTATPPSPWQRIIERARAAGDHAPEVPAGLTASLRGYQREGFTWLARLAAWGAGAVLADDMGLGKTVQAIAALLSRATAGPALVVAPTSVVHNWRRELARFGPSLRVLGGRDEAAHAAGPGDVVLISYGVLVRDVERVASSRWATLVVDEAQFIKNPSARRAQAVRAIDAEWRLALSGTPVENDLGDLWSVFAAIAPGLLGSMEHFRARWMGRPTSELDGLRRLLRPFLLRRTKEEVLTELPPKTEVVVDVDLSVAERQLYEDARISAVAQLRGLGEELRSVTGRFKVLAELTRLRQLACDPSLVIEDGPPSSKLARLLELVSALIEERHSVLVFSQFTRLLDRAEARLGPAGVPCLRLDGQTPAEARGRIVEAFQSGPPRVLLVSLKAGGTGLNLTAADYVVHLDPWWNPAAEDQATDRAHRIGQTRPLTVLRLVSRGTVEATILELHAEKRALAAAVLEGGEASRALDGAELLALLEGREREAAEPEDDGAAEVGRAGAAPAPSSTAGVGPAAEAAKATTATAPSAAAVAAAVPEVATATGATARLEGARPSLAAAVDWAELARRASVRMDAELSASTARRYRAVADALLALARAHGLREASADVLTSLWVAEVQAGRRAPTEVAVGRAVARRLCAEA